MDRMVVGMVLVEVAMVVYSNSYFDKNYLSYFELPKKILIELTVGSHIFH